MQKARKFAIALAIVLMGGTSWCDAASVWNLPAGGSWNTAANWNPSGVPSGTGTSVTFNGVATGSNPAQTGNRTVTADGAQTVGSILFNTDLSTFTNSITTGTSGSTLTFDESGSGPAAITTTGAGTGNNTISVAMTLTDDVVANVNNTAASSAAGSLNLTGTMAGPGGFTKNGDGLATFGTGAKTYAGATVINGGRLRSSSLAAPTATSSFTINAGGQLDLITAATYLFGAGPLNLNGSGPTTGPSAAFPGAIRNDTNLATAIGNPVVLQSDTLLHVQGATSGAITFTSGVSGPGKLSLTAPGSNADLGKLILNGANTYGGGTLVRGGIVQVSGAGATLGTGDVTVLSGGALFTGAVAQLQIASGVLNAISDTATLSLAGIDGFANLGAGVNDVVGGLVLGGIPQLTLGTYGSVGSGATFQSNTFFTGTGVVTLIPEPTSFVLFALGAVGVATRRRQR